MSDEYTTSPTHVRIFKDTVQGREHWFIDAMDEETGTYSEVCWEYDHVTADYIWTRERAVELVPAFVEDTGFTGLPLIEWPGMGEQWVPIETSAPIAWRAP